MPVSSLKSICIDKIINHLRWPTSPEDRKVITCSPNFAKLPVNISNTLFNKAIHYFSVAFELFEYYVASLSEIDISDRDLDADLSNFMNKRVFTKLKIGANRSWFHDENCKPRLFLDAAFNNQSRGKLTILEFYCTGSWNRDFFDVPDMLSYFPNLETLICKHQGCAEYRVPCSVLTNGIEHILEQPRKLKVLDLSYPEKLAHGEIDLNTLVKNLPALEVLSLRFANLKGAFKELFKLKRLKVLDVCNCFYEDEISRFEAGDVAPELPNLQFLEWSYNPITHRVLEKLLQLAPNLKQIGLLETNLTYEKFTMKNVEVLNAGSFESILLALRYYSQGDNETLLRELAYHLRELPETILINEDISTVFDTFLDELQQNLESELVSAGCIAVIKAIWVWYNTEPRIFPFSSSQIVKMVSLLTSSFKRYCHPEYSNLQGFIFKDSIDLLRSERVLNTSRVNKLEMLNELHLSSIPTHTIEFQIMINFCQTIMEQLSALEDKSGVIFNQSRPFYIPFTSYELGRGSYGLNFTEDLVNYYRVYIPFLKEFQDLSKMYQNAESDLDRIAQKSPDADLKTQILEFVQNIKDARLASGTVNFDVRDHTAFITTTDW